jgi:replicative DNA helicase
MTPEEFAERALLGLLVGAPERISEVGPHLAGTDFTDPRCGVLYTLIRDHMASPTRRGESRSELASGTLAAIWPELDHNFTADEVDALMAAAPPPGRGQPAVYAELVMEASIRRQITALGYEAARLSAQTPPVAELVAAQETITAHLDSAQQRWEAITATSDLVRALTTEPDADGGVERDLFGRPVLPTPATPAPSPQQVHAAQEQVIGGVLRHPGVADALLGRLEPTDFLDPQLGNALDAAQQVHAQAAVTGRQVDPVTVAWALQTLPDDRGPTPPPEYLHDLATTAEPNHLDSAVDLVMRASLAKLTAQAAATAQHAAQQPAMAPGDVLAAARSAYQTVDTAAHRLTGRTSTDYQLGVLDNRAATADPVRSTADLAGLRSRSTALLQQTTAGPAGSDTTGLPGISSRLDAVESPDVHQEVHRDAGPGLG